VTPPAVSSHPLKDTAQTKPKPSRCW